VVTAAARAGLAPLSGTSPVVGVVGYTLGGGRSWLSRVFGFAADSVVLAEIVTADGEVRTVTADREPDLFWAIRGGGGNFGVVTALEFRLCRVTEVYAGAATFPLAGRRRSRCGRGVAPSPGPVRTPVRWGTATSRTR
jgi:FAD/FMN-containing dehydrogenase